MDNLLLQIIEILKYTLPALIVFGTAYFTLTSYLRKEMAAKALGLKMNRHKDVVMLRLQAYERLALFLERIRLESIIERVLAPDMKAAELQYALTQTIQNEFEYNLSQQMYVSSDAWKIVTQTKEEMIKTVNLIAAGVQPGETATVLAGNILTCLRNANAIPPNEYALEYLKTECRELF